METDNELRALTDSIRKVLEKECSIETVQKFYQSDASYLEPLWRTAVELGCTALAIPEAYEGLGMNISAVAALYRQAGAALAPIPLFSSLLATEALVRGGSDAMKTRWLPRIAAGELRGTVSPPHFAPAATVSAKNGILILNGTAAELLDGAAADLLIILAEYEGQTRRVLVERQLPGVSLTELPLTDRTRRMATASFAMVSIRPEAFLINDIETALECHAAIGLAEDAIGGAHAILNATIEYMKTRQQFGRPIGSFQALKHRVADHRTNLMGAEAFVDEVVSLAARDAAQPMDCWQARSHACATYGAIAADCLQLHGGIGFTWEYLCHLFLKRARLNEALFGGNERALERAALALAA